MLCCQDVEILNFLKRERQNKEREKDKDRERSALCWTGSKSRQLPGPGESFLSTSFLRFQFQQQTTHPLFQKKLWSGGRAVRVGSRASSCDAAGGSAAPPQPLSGFPPPFFSLARACNLLAFFFSGQSFGRCAPLAQLRGRRAEKNERRVSLFVGCSLFQRKRQNKKNLKLKCTNSRSLAEAERSFSLL